MYICSYTYVYNSVLEHVFTYILYSFEGVYVDYEHLNQLCTACRLIVNFFGVVVQ